MSTLLDTCEKVRNALPVGGWRRFLISGGCNTLASYGLYLVLLRSFSHGVAYTLAYLSGIALAYVLYRHFVYQARGGALRMAGVASAYVIQYAVGLTCVNLWVAAGGWAALAPFCAIAVTTPLMFFLSRKIFARSKPY
ncbi:hypothetical protein KYG_02377 [Acidovorax sp. NO-1]|uniref:GtrA family protein n=1 Tax=Acidovorax sp. NO-1 TaxID=512030 RepID=UPI00023FCDCB|nr:GtrA family protein [Acidovorax sp. NO-1]EHL24479.1 hypothetical protein KYG_02377 [Acidovorax sp. NO-1]